MKTIVIAGGTGYLGKCLTSYFQEKGYKLIILSRQKSFDGGHVKFLKWDAKNLGPWTEALENADALINLAGKSVDCRYIQKNKKLIYDSRLNATEVLGKAITALKQPPKVWINASSATIYQQSTDKEMDEQTGEIGSGFSVDVCKKWEESFNKFALPRTRKVILRTAIVLGNTGGALQPLKRLVKMGLGGKQGNGQQYFSWLHENDFNRIVEYCILNDQIKGVYNAAAPHPVMNITLMSLLRKAYKMPIGIPTPKLLLEIGALIIRTETELVLKSRFVVPTKFLDTGFLFKFENLEEALSEITSF